MRGIATIVTSLGEPPVFSNGKAEFTAWLSFHKEKWELQRKIRQQGSTAKVTISASGEGV